jgi:glucose-6-phosphate 1-dehydrogenase
MPPLDVTRVVRGLYAGYSQEPGVDPRSQTETFIATRVEVDNRRWRGVPFYLRSGKFLGQRRQMIDFADPGSISAHFLAKEPGTTMRLGKQTMTFRYADSFRTQHEYVLRR